MKSFFAVFKFTYLDAVKKKAFIISTGIILAAVLIVCMLPKLVSLFGGSSDGAAEGAQDGAFMYYLDESACLTGAPEALKQMGYSVIEIAPEQAENVQDKIRTGEADLLVWIRSANGAPEAEIFVKDFMNAPDTNMIREALNKTAAMNRMRAAGASEEVIALSLDEIPVCQTALGDMDVAGFAFGLIASMLMFFAVYFYGLGVANSVAMEKTSRVMETLVISARPSAILAGKCVAMGAAGLTQMTGILAFGAVCFHFLVPAGTTIFGIALTLSGVTFTNAVIVILYFLLGYALYAMLYAVCGATVSRIEDVSSALMPVSMVSMVAFYLGYFTSVMGGASGAIEWAARYVPFCAPFGMPFRLMNGSVGIEECMISLGAMLAAIVIVTVICTRLYERSVMHYGKRLKLRELFKLKA